MGPKDLKKKLEEDHKCEIHYDTIWKGRQIAIVWYSCLGTGRKASKCYIIGGQRF